MVMRRKLFQVPGMFLLTVCAVAACGQSESASSPNSEAGETTVRPSDARILAVEDGAECDPSVVEYTKNDFRLELVAKGQEGDVFSYEVRKKDGAVVTGTSQEFGEDQKQAIFTTGVTTMDVDRITVTAHGTAGVGGTCVLTLRSS